jgi:hypothetical protein
MTISMRRPRSDVRHFISAMTACAPMRRPRSDVRHFISAVAACAAVGLAGPARADCPTEYEFVVIADDREELSLTDPAYIPDRTIPSLGPGGRVAFTAWLDDGGKAILVGDENTLVARVRDRAADPDSDWTFLGPALLAGDIAYFTGQLEVDEPPLPQSFQALGAVNNGKVVDEIVVSSPGADLTGIGSLDVTSGGRVAFQSYRQADGQVIAVAGFNEPPRVIESGEPGGYGHVSVGRVDEVSYLRFAPPGPALISSSGAVVAETDAKTGLGPEGPVSMGPGTGIAYVFAHADPARPGYAAQQIRRWNPQTQTSSILADSANGDFSRHANGVVVSLLDQTEIAADQSQGWGGCVVFLGVGDEGRDTIYIADTDGIGVVVHEGDAIEDGFAGPLGMGPLAVNALGQIAFWANLGSRVAIVRADPVGAGPGPGEDSGDDAGEDPGDDAGGDPGEDPREDPGGEGGCASVSRGGPAGWSSALLVALAVGLWSMSLRRRSARAQNEPYFIASARR